MNKKHIKKVFDEVIKKKLGKIRTKEKYFSIFSQIAEFQNSKNKKGIRINELKERNSARHQLNKMVKLGFIKVIPPEGDGKLLIDPIEENCELYKKSEMINKYYKEFRYHINENQETKKIVKKILGLNENKFQMWLNSLESQRDFFKSYNKVISELKNKKVIFRGFGYLKLINMPNHYVISDKIKKLIGE